MSAVPTVYAALAQHPVDADISSLRLPDRRRVAAAQPRSATASGPTPACTLTARATG